MRPFTCMLLLLMISLTACRGPVSTGETDDAFITDSNPFPFSKWEGIEADGDSVRLEFSDTHVSFYKRRYNGPCWMHRGISSYSVEDKTLKTTILDGGRNCLSCEYNGGTLYFPDFQGDWGRWFKVGNFRTRMEFCP